MALGCGAKLAQVVDLSDVGPEVPAHAEGERDHVLSECWTEVALDAPMGRGGSFDGRRETLLHAELSEPRRHIETERGAEQLAVRGEHAMAVQVPVRREVGDDVEG